MSVPSFVPEKAKPLCPVCGGWGFGKSERDLETHCRVFSAWLIAQGRATRKEIIEKINALEFREGRPLPNTFPEPIDWSHAATLEFIQYPELVEWVKKQALEYGE